MRELTLVIYGWKPSGLVQQATYSFSLMRDKRYCKHGLSCESGVTAKAVWGSRIAVVDM